MVFAQDPPSIPLPPEPTKPAVCANLGTKQSRMRMYAGFVLLVFGIFMGVWCVSNDANEMLRMSVFIPVFLGYIGILQARGKTCILLALNGTMDDEQGSRAVTDSILKNKLRWKALRVVLLSAFLAALWTLLCLGITKESFWPQSGSQNLAPTYPNELK